MRGHVAEVELAVGGGAGQARAQLAGMIVDHPLVVAVAALGTQLLNASSPLSVLPRLCAMLHHNKACILHRRWGTVRQGR